MTKKVLKKDEEWRRQLSANQFKICRQKGTEPAFSGDYWDTKETGVYQCICCDNELFDSSTKFDSGTGWPSFYQAISPQQVTTKEDSSLFMKRTEVYVINAIRTWVMFFPMDLNQPVCDSVSTQHHSS